MEEGNGTLAFQRRGCHPWELISVCLGNTRGTLGFRAQSPEPSCPL